MVIENRMASDEAKTNAIDLLVMVVVDELAQDLHLDTAELLLQFVVSKTGKLLFDESSKLWWSGPSDIAQMYKTEIGL